MQSAKPAPQKSNRKVLIYLSTIVLGMTALAYASVPLYKLFCQVTGFGGTPRISNIAADEVLERQIKVRFDANVDRKLAWAFKPSQLTQVSFVGESVLASYQATNISDVPIAGGQGGAILCQAGLFLLYRASVTAGRDHEDAGFVLY